MSTRARRLLLLLLIGVGVCVAFCFDRAIAEHVAAHPSFNKHSAWIACVKSPGNYWFTAMVATALLLRHPMKLRSACLPLIAGAIGGVTYWLLKWIVGRHRPVVGIAPFSFHPFVDGWRGLISEKALSFPSGHTTLSFATAASLAILIPRWRGLWFALAGLVAVERVLENAHYLSEVVAGAGLGLLSAWAAQHLIDHITSKVRKQNTCASTVAASS